MDMLFIFLKTQKLSLWQIKRSSIDTCKRLFEGNNMWALCSFSSYISSHLSSEIIKLHLGSISLIGWIDVDVILVCLCNWVQNPGNSLFAKRSKGCIHQTLPRPYNV